MPTSSPRAAASSSWLRASVACRRLGVTASNAIARRVSAWLRAQRIQDWITASPTSPEGPHALLEELGPGQRDAFGRRVGEQLSWAAGQAACRKGARAPPGQEEGSNLFRNGTVGL